jgi:hypothetical protein
MADSPVFPDVGDEIVVGSNSALVLDMVLFDDAGVSLGVNPNRFTIQNTNSTGVTTSLYDKDSRLVDIAGSGVGSTATLTVGFVNQPFTHEYSIRPL